MNPYSVEFLARERIQDRLQEAEGARMGRAARGSRPARRTPLSVVRRLTARLAPAT